MEEAKAVVDMSPWMSVIGACVGWTAFLILIGMLKTFIVTGFSMFIAELIWKSANKDSQNKLARKLADSEKVLEYLKELESQGIKQVSDS